jgi:hypothetical protein
LKEVGPGDFQIRLQIQNPSPAFVDLVGSHPGSVCFSSWVLQRRCLRELPCSTAPAFIDLVGSLGTSLLWPRVLRRLCRHRLPLPALPGLVAAALGPLTLLYAPMGPPAALLDLVGLILLDAH